jgi:hypothetical protein
MHGARRNIAALASTIDLRFAIHGERHLASEDDVGSFCVMRVIGIERVRSILPYVRMSKSLTVQLRG